MVSNQPIVFNLQYTPYRPPRNATKGQRERHAHNRAFYDMTAAGETILSYMARDDKAAETLIRVPRAPPDEDEQKPAARYTTILEYLQKSTRVFNGKGMISEDELAAMKKRAKENKGNITMKLILDGDVNVYYIQTLCMIFFPGEKFGAAGQEQPDTEHLVCSQQPYSRQRQTTQRQTSAGGQSGHGAPPSGRGIRMTWDSP